MAAAGFYLAIGYLLHVPTAGERLLRTQMVVNATNREQGVSISVLD
jgi:hypothetical protein